MLKPQAKSGHFAAPIDAQTRSLGDSRDGVDAELSVGQRSHRLVTGHRERAVLAFVNILRNAVQATAGTRPAITVSVLALENAPLIRVTFDDNGPGVPPERRSLIFEEGISYREGGSGMGLALAREVFETELRGTVVCETAPTGGARFTVTLPATGTRPP